VLFYVIFIMTDSLIDGHLCFCYCKIDAFCHLLIKLLCMYVCDHGGHRSSGAIVLNKLFMRHLMLLYSISLDA